MSIDKDGYDDAEGDGDRNWIYVGGDINNTDWSKVGKTTGSLTTRHRSSQNPGFYIYTAFQVVRGSVDEIEANLIKDLKGSHGLEALAHFSTTNTSECFQLNPDEMTGLVEHFISNNYASCVRYETQLHGGISRYQADRKVVHYVQNQSHSAVPLPRPQPRALGSKNYFTGNQETHEVDLGGGFYVDVASGMQMHRDNDE